MGFSIQISNRYIFLSRKTNQVRSGRVIMEPQKVKRWSQWGTQVPCRHSLRALLTRCQVELS